MTAQSLDEELIINVARKIESQEARSSYLDQVPVVWCEGPGLEDSAIAFGLAVDGLGDDVSPPAVLDVTVHGEELLPSAVLQNEANESAPCA